jgi:hypothetical protein
MSESGLRGRPDDALVDLLVKQVTEGLSAAEQRELDAMDSALVTAESQSFERAAAAATLAAITPVELPAGLRAQLHRQAEAQLAAGTVVPLRGPPAATIAAAPAVPASRSGTWGWLAAAACLVLAVLGWVRSPPSAPTIADNGNVAPSAVPVEPQVQPLVPPESVAPPTPAEERTAMLAQADSIKVTLGATKDPAAAGVTGDVVWDPASQKGFVHFVGLATNDPQVRQYQIWVFDGTRDKRYPVDGGVFDVPADQPEVVIPIHAALSIRQAKAFAITVEKPGGVVVSSLGHVVALGAVG